MILAIIASVILFLTFLNIMRMGFFLGGVFIYDIKRGLQKKQHKQKSAAYNPKVSVIIPAHNEQKVVIRCLKSVVDNTYKNLEIIVVDDGSKDKTYTKLLYYKSILKRRRFKLIRQKRGGKATALNRAIKNHVTGELVMCLDADSILDRHAIANAVVYFQDKKTKAIAANVKIIDQPRLMSLIQRYEYLISYSMKKSLTAYNLEYIVGGVGSVFRTSILKQVGGYNTKTMTEDINLTLKVVNRGNKANRVVYAQDVVAYTEAVQTMADLIKQRFRWKYGRFQSFVLYSGMFFSTKKRHTKALTWFFMPYAIFAEFMLFLEPIFIGFVIFVIFTTHNTTPLVYALTILTIYICFNILAEKKETALSKLKLILLSPIMYGLFFSLSFVEFLALIKSMLDVTKILAIKKRGISHSHWQHVTRTG